MLSFQHPGPRLCDGWTRREWLRVGGLSALGLSSAALLRAQATSVNRQGRAKACIVLFLMGGPPHAIDQATPRDGGNEYFLRALVGIETAGAAPDIREDFLDGVFGIGTRAGQTPGDGPDETAELIDALVHGTRISLCDSSEY